MTETIGDILRNALAGDQLKTADLVNLTFVLVATGEPFYQDRPEEKNEDGSIKRHARRDKSYNRVTITLDGESQTAWLGGGFLTPQIDALVEKGALPCRVKLIRDTSKDGSPYILTEPAGSPQLAPASRPQAEPAQPAPAAANGMQTPAQRAADLFAAALAAFGPDALMEVAVQTTTEHAVTMDGDALVLDPNLLSLQQAVRLVQRLEGLSRTETLPFDEGSVSAAQKAMHP